jgi:translation initiation factor 1
MDPFTFKPFDPFSGGGGLTSLTKQPMLEGPKGNIHVRMNKQGSRYITMIEGLDSDLDQQRIAKAMKKAFSCSTSVQKDKEGNEVILLQGDHRMHVKEWLLAQEILTAKEASERLMLHGY